MKLISSLACSLFLITGCTTPDQDLSVASRDFLCENYEYWDGGALAKPYIEELKRRGVNCDGFNRKADTTIEIN